MKKILLFLLLIENVYVVYAYDFSAVSPSGHTLYYNILGGTAQVTFYSTNGHINYTGNMIIPSTVTYNNVVFSVSQIGPNAFKDCSGISSVTISEGIIYISGSAFKNCSGLTSVTIPNSVQSINTEAFNGCYGLTSIICFGNTPPSTIGTPFYGISIYSAVIQVPCGTSSQYASATGWNYFSVSNFEEYNISLDYTLSANVSPSCTWMGSAYVICNGVEAVPNYGYHFTQWNDGNTDNPRSITQLTHNTTYTASFAKNNYHITANYNGIDGYAVGDTIAEYLSTATITAVANPRYHFVQWQDGDTNNPRSIVVTADSTFTPVFVGKQYRVEVQTIGGDTSCRASISSSYYGGTDTVATMTYNSSPVYYLNAYINPAPSAYQFKRWTDGSTMLPRPIVSRSGNVASNDNILSDTVFVAEFERRPISISTNVGSGTSIGVTGWTSGDTTVLYGDSVTITATPNNHWHFHYWQGSQPYYDNPLTIAATENATYRAYFDIDRHIVTCLTDGGGTALNDNDISGHRHYQAEWNYNQQVRIFATPNEGNRFVMWNDSNVYATRTITVLSDTTFTAYFAPIENLRDTIYIIDTIYIHDTVYITQDDVDDVAVTNVKMYVQDGGIVVENVDGYSVALYDALGRIIHNIRQSDSQAVHIPVPTSGTYLVKVGNLPARKIVVIR